MLVAGDEGDPFVGVIENGCCFAPELVFAGMRPQGLAKPHPVIEALAGASLDDKPHLLLRDDEVLTRFFVVGRLLADAFCCLILSACAWVMSPFLTRAPMQTFDTRLMERDMQARRPSVPTL